MYFPFFYDPTYVLVFIGVVISAIVSAYMQSTYAKYSRIGANCGMSASEVVKTLLDVNNIHDIALGHVPGHLTDHYAPKNKTINLSDTTYNSNSIAAIGVAAHECGHILQDEKNYAPLVLSMRVTPIVAFASNASVPIIILSIVLGMMNLLNIGIILFAVTFLYQVLTLPIEFNASKRAIESLRQTQILNEAELDGAKKVLTAAALTYVAAMVTSALQLLRFMLIARSRSRD